MTDAFNYWGDESKKVPTWVFDHPWMAIFQDTLKQVEPEHYNELDEQYALVPWAAVNTWLALRFAEQYHDDGMSETEAYSTALAEFLPKTAEDEMQYTDGDDRAAQEEAALEMIDLLNNTIDE